MWSRLRSTTTPTPARRREALEDETIYTTTAAAVSYWLPQAEQGRVLAIAPTPLMKTMVTAAKALAQTAADDDAPQAELPPDLEQLVGMLDRTRHLTLFGSPQYLLSDGRSVLEWPLEKLVEPLGDFCGAGLRPASKTWPSPSKTTAHQFNFSPMAESSWGGCRR